MFLGNAVTKRASMVVSDMVGIPAGLFSPSLSIGAGLVQSVHAAFAWVPMQAFIALRRTGDLAAVALSTLTSFVIVIDTQLRSMIYK